jgi:hypothetical protein
VTGNAFSDFSNGILIIDVRFQQFFGVVDVHETIKDNTFVQVGIRQQTVLIH